ncbi:MAG: GNAT family N-acetyltransferase [Casimicrobiaceae bacterium]
MNVGRSLPGRLHIVDAATIRARRPEFVALLDDAVSDGASVGFLSPPEPATLAPFWDRVADDVARGERVVFISEREGRIVGTVQVAPCMKDNGRHRAEVQKLLVHGTARRSGIARGLMAAAEAHAVHAGWWLLLLDTRESSAAEALYRGLGWTEIGRVPDYARDPDRTLASCVFFYKRIGR